MPKRRLQMRQQPRAGRGGAELNSWTNQGSHVRQQRPGAMNAYGALGQPKQQEQQQQEQQQRSCDEEEAGGETHGGAGVIWRVCSAHRAHGAPWPSTRAHLALMAPRVNVRPEDQGGLGTRTHKTSTNDRRRLMASSLPFFSFLSFSFLFFSFLSFSFLFFSFLYFFLSFRFFLFFLSFISLFVSPPLPRLCCFCFVQLLPNLSFFISFVLSLFISFFLPPSLASFSFVCDSFLFCCLLSLFLFLFGK